MARSNRGFVPEAELYLVGEPSLLTIMSGWDVISFSCLPGLFGFVHVLDMHT